MDVVRRGDLWITALDPTVGAEIRKARPALVVSPDTMNDHLPMVMIVPLTSKGRAAPFRVRVEIEGRAGLLLCDQVRAVSKERLRQRVGRIDKDQLLATLETLRNLFTS